jgi:alkylation response protein AidB-like acyl-CoA dehydrogenase
MAVDASGIGREMRAWIEARVLAHANAWEEAQALPPEILDEFGAQGWFGAGLPGDVDGLELDSAALCRFCAEMARGRRVALEPVHRAQHGRPGPSCAGGHARAARSLA